MDATPPLALEDATAAPQPPTPSATAGFTPKKSAAPQPPTPAATAGFTLKKAASRGVKIPTVRAASPPPKAKSTTPSQSDGWLRGASGAVLQMVCGLGRQLLSMAGMEPKWTGLWIVLEAEDGSAASPFMGKVINCAVGAATEHDDLAKDWWEFRGGHAGRRRRQQAKPNTAGVGTRPASKTGAGGRAGPGGGGLEGQRRGGGGQESDGGSGDAASSDSGVYPPTTQHTCGTVAAVLGGELGTKELTTAELNKLLARAGLKHMREISTDDLADVFGRGSGLLCERLGAHIFSWALSCPIELLRNTWTTPALPVSVDGSHFLPLKHPSSKGHGTDRKRLVLCVAAHLSLFFGPRCLTSTSRRHA